MLMKMSVEEGIEHELWIFLIVTYLPLISQTFTFLRKVKAEGVYPCTVVDK